MLDAVGEEIECKSYDRVSHSVPNHTHLAFRFNVLAPNILHFQWIVYSPGGTFPCVAGREQYLANIRAQGGPEALEQWLKLEKLLEPLQRGAALFPAAAVRSDPGVILTSARFLGLEMAMTGLVASTLTVGPSHVGRN